jgi:hypothetical protein
MGQAKGKRQDASLQWEIFQQLMILAAPQSS